MVFDEINRQFDDRWDCYYSVWFRDTAPGEHAEADFALAGPDGIFLFEVKGGRVERLEDGRWQFRTSAGRLADTRSRGPFDQVRDAWYAMKEHLKGASGKSLVEECIWGYGVITPECQLRFSGPDPGGPAKLWLDESRFPERLTDFVKEVADYWRQDYQRRERRGIGPRQLTIGDRATLERALKPVVRCVLGAGVEARQIGREMVKLTYAQTRALDYAQLDPRLVVQGGAGTGKTLVAMEKTAREASAKHRVLYVCFNRLLADHLARDPRMQGATVETYHQLVYRLIRSAGMHTVVAENWNEFNRSAPDLVLEALARLGDRFVPWDYLVLDEAQDLMTGEFVSVLDSLLKGGIAGGQWLVCLDTEQAIFSSQFDAEYFAQFVTASGARPLVLPDNCRNTRQIAAYGHGVGGVLEKSRATIEGRMPVFDYYADHEDLRRKLKKTLNRLVSEFRDAKLDVSGITVLLGKLEPYSELATDVLAGCVARGHWLKPGDALDSEKVQIATIQSFKGLESDAIILLGIDDLEAEWQRRLFYVASTRARAVLEVLLPESQQQSIGSASVEIVMKLLRPALESSATTI